MTVKSTPPMSTVSPTEGRPLNNCSRTRAPRKTTRRRSSSSSELIQRPLGRLFVPHISIFRTHPAHRRRPHHAIAIRNPRPPHRFQTRVPYKVRRISFTMSRSACSKTTSCRRAVLPAVRWSAAARQMTAPLPNASKPLTRISRETATISNQQRDRSDSPHDASIVRALRVRLRRSAAQASLKIEKNMGSGSRSYFFNLTSAICN